MVGASLQRSRTLWRRLIKRKMVQQQRETQLLDNADWLIHAVVSGARAESLY